MGRHVKKGLDYFPLDLSLDDEVEMLEAKYGLEGFAIWIKLLQRIYRYGYYTNWTEREQLLFAKANGMKIDVVNSLVDDCINYGLFDGDIHSKYHVLTSRGIQKRYFTSVARRRKIEVCNELLLVDIENYLSVGDNIIDVNINRLNSSISTQSKGKESKGKEIPAKINASKKNECYHPLAQRLLELHLEIDPAFMGKKASNGFIEKSADAFRLLVERDGRNRKEVETILEWCKRDDFWSSVIQSGGGFRRNYGQMKTQWQRRVKKEEAEMQKEGFTLEEDIDL